MTDSRSNGVRKWAVDFTDPSNGSTRDIPDPLGYHRQMVEQDEIPGKGSRHKDADSSWKQKKAWEAATAPAKNILMVGFMLWMAGSTVHIFGMGIVFSALMQPISALRQVNKTFEPFQDSKTDLVPPKTVFVLIQLAGLLIGLWKLNALGLLPTGMSDLLATLPPRPDVELSSGGYMH